MIYIFIIIGFREDYSFDVFILHINLLFIIIGFREDYSFDFFILHINLLFIIGPLYYDIHIVC
jgi:hypothetical protein